jgi:predicted glycoside hydrolase/deacetylase ChbG (UPF0249 family)
MLIINADDLAMTPGANRAIFDGFDQGGITHASIMANCDYFDEAIEGVQQREALGLGMHLNLTYGKSLLNNPLYCDNNGVFNLGYLDLLKKRDNEFLTAVEAEWDAQIQRVLSFSNKEQKLTHIDSHRHIHLIQHLYKVAVKLTKKYKIQRVRLVNENIYNSFMLTKRVNFILNGGIIKYLLLRSFSAVDARHCNLYKDTKFYSILYTGVIGADIIKKLQNSQETYEIMVHPSYPELDKDVQFYDEAEKAYRVSNDRKKELEAVLSIKK